MQTFLGVSQIRWWPIAILELPRFYTLLSFTCTNLLGQFSVIAIVVRSCQVTRRCTATGSNISKKNGTHYNVFLSGKPVFIARPSAILILIGIRITVHRLLLIDSKFVHGPNVRRSQRYFLPWVTVKAIGHCLLFQDQTPCFTRPNPPAYDSSLTPPIRRHAKAHHCRKSDRWFHWCIELDRPWPDRNKCTAGGTRQADCMKTWAVHWQPVGILIVFPRMDLVQNEIRLMTVHIYRRARTDTNMEGNVAGVFQDASNQTGPERGSRATSSWNLYCEVISQRSSLRVPLHYHHGFTFHPHCLLRFPSQFMRYRLCNSSRTLIQSSSFFSL